jgi:hypothetical protein
MIKALKILLISITVIVCIVIGFIIFVLSIISFSGGSSTKAALPSSVNGRQLELYNLLSNKIWDGKESEINSCAKEFLSNKIDTIHEYRLVDGKVVMSYYPYPWQKLYSKIPDKRSYTLDYTVYPNGKIIVFTYGVPHQHEWDKISKDKDIMITYSEKSVKDNDFDYKLHLHYGEYVSKEELKSIMNKMSDTNPPPAPLAK